ncbi:Fungal transcriptional regulatory protein [Akanthomyces lecanii RCEF 1005]|uniref:Fungal transcriptional regulatory protein n=1 Tax=Akanthomyces lecanii RCEF 1005 TaxID=1081108 RepID=A0A168BDC6_CORDF|nr:Fungal transcriptional regulatory protein [Akanthomyces lecanii RCEF 1005]
MQNHLMATPNGGAMGMAEYAMNLRNMDYMGGLAQPSMPSHPYLGSQIPPGADNYFPFHQVVPDLWPNQSHEQVQQLHQQQNHHQLGHHHHHHHHQQDAVFDQVSAAPLVIPDPAATQQTVFSSLPPQHQQYLLLHHQQRAAPILGSRRRQGPVPVLSHPPLPTSATERRSRSNIVRINYTDLVPHQQDILSGSHIMDQFFQIYARVRVLSVNLERLEQGKDHSDGPDGKPNEFTIAELYKHTHEVIDVLERVVAVRGAPNTTAADCPLDATDAVNSMFTLSLYARILDLLQRVFALVRGLLAQADPKKDDTFPSWLLPEMNIGAASIGAHPAFHMSLTVQLAMQFLSRFREATVYLGLINAAATNGNEMSGSSAPPDRRGSSDGVSAASLSFGDIKNREGNLSKLLGQLQDELNNFMDTMDAIDAKEEEDKK